MKRLIGFAACVAMLAACSPQKPAAPPATSPKFNSALAMNEYMAHVVDPAAFAYWKGSGTEITGKGEKDLTPTNEEGWEALESAAAALIEAGNSLQLPGRARQPEADWYKFAQELSERGVAAKAAAEKKDKDAVFAEGAKVYQVCTACHKEYVIDPALKAQGGPPEGKLPDWPADVQAKQKAFDAKATH